MKPRRSVHSSLSSLRLALLFCGIVAFLLLIAVSLRIWRTSEKNVFDGQHQFILLIQHNEQYLLTVFAPSAHSVTAFPLHASMTEPVGRDLEVGIDGKVVLADDISANVQEDLMNAIFHTSSANVTWIDLLRLYFLARGATITQTTQIFLPKQQLTADQVKNGFSDPIIGRDSQSIQILNASDISGLGNRLSVLVTNLGGNVIDIRTSTDTQKYSEIDYYGTISYTASRFSHMLGFPLRPQKQQGIADVKIIIGEDATHTDKF